MTKKCSVSTEYGDIIINRATEFSGDEVVFQTFAGHIKIDGNNPSAAGAKFNIITNEYYNTHGRTGSLGSGATSHLRPHNTTITVHNVEPFMPIQLAQKYNRLKFDIAITGAIAWETDMYLPFDRYMITTRALQFLQRPANALAQAINVPFNYFDLAKNPKASISEWGTTFKKAVTDMVTVIKNNLMQDVITGLAASIIPPSHTLGDVDEVMGMNLNVLIPISTIFYNDLLTLKSKNQFLKDIFTGNSLIATYDFTESKRTSLSINFGFIPESNPSNTSSRAPYAFDGGVQGPSHKPTPHASIHYKGGIPSPEKDFDSGDWYQTLNLIKIVPTA